MFIFLVARGVSWERQGGLFPVPFSVSQDRCHVDQLVLSLDPVRDGKAFSFQGRLDRCQDLIEFCILAVMAVGQLLDLRQLRLQAGQGSIKFCSV